MAVAQVPKMLGALRQQWCPQSMVVSFKLETDQQILLKKVRRYDLLVEQHTGRSSASLARARAAEQRDA